MDSIISRVTFPVYNNRPFLTYKQTYSRPVFYFEGHYGVCFTTHQEPFIFSPLLLRSLCFPLFRRTYYASASSMRVQFGRCRGIMTNQPYSGSTFHFGFAASLVSVYVIPQSSEFMLLLVAPPSQQGQGFISHIFSHRRR